MSRATPDLTQGFTGVSLPKIGPRQMGTDADGRTSVVTLLNQVTESIASMHDNQTNTRPDYLPENGMWCFTASDGTKTVYQYNGKKDVSLWEMDTTGTATLFMTPQTNATIKIVNGVMVALAAPLGDIQLKPFRPEDLATNCPGWHFCNGDQYILSSSVGQALNALPTNLKTGFGIFVSGGNISIPNMFHPDGRGYFLRAVNGATRLVGSVENEALQDHRHIMGQQSIYPSNGSASAATVNLTNSATGSLYTGNKANETRPLNRGMTPAIFLGV